MPSLLLFFPCPDHALSWLFISLSLLPIIYFPSHSFPPLQLGFASTSIDPAQPHTVHEAGVLQDCFEVGRRYKIMNPDRMRSDYGKLMYLLMDASEPDIQDLLEFNCVRPLRTGA